MLNAIIRCPLRKLHRAIGKKRRFMLSSGMIMLHDNTRPHVASKVQDALAQEGWEVFHPPDYSGDMSPYDFQLLKPFRNG